jgi:hypothetical protein
MVNRDLQSMTLAECRAELAQLKASLAEPIGPSAFGGASLYDQAIERAREKTWSRHSAVLRRIAELGGHVEIYD